MPPMPLEKSPCLYFYIFSLTNFPLYSINKPSTCSLSIIAYVYLFEQQHFVVYRLLQINSVRLHDPWVTQDFQFSNYVLLPLIWSSVAIVCNYTHVRSKDYRNEYMPHQLIIFWMLNLQNFNLPYWYTLLYHVCIGFGTG